MRSKTSSQGDVRIFWQIDVPKRSPLNIYVLHLTLQNTLMHMWAHRSVSLSKTLRLINLWQIEL